LKGTGMATQWETDQAYLDERLARLRLAVEESEKFSAETRRIVADMIKTQAETKILPWSMIFQLATAALLGAGAAIAKLFFP
jgi:hypothetical protein